MKYFNCQNSLNQTTTNPKNYNPFGLSFSKPTEINTEKYIFSAFSTLNNNNDTKYQQSLYNNINNTTIVFQNIFPNKRKADDDLQNNQTKKIKTSDKSQPKIPIDKIKKINEKVIIVDDELPTYSKEKRKRLEIDNELSKLTCPQLKQLAQLLDILPHRMKEKVRKQILEKDTIDNIKDIINKVSSKIYYFTYGDLISKPCHYVYVNDLISPEKIIMDQTFEERYANDYYRNCPICNKSRLEFRKNEFCMFTNNI
jgi:hypothetical protein